MKRAWVVASLAFFVFILAPFSVSTPLKVQMVRGAVLYDSGDPTAEEQLVLEYINRARADPVAEGQRLGIDIHEGLADPTLVGSRPPLVMNRLLLGIAQAHSRDMYNLNYFSHNDPNGTTPFDRMVNAGYDYMSAGENMAAGTYTTAAQLQNLLMIDAGTAGRLHRVNLLDLFQAYPCGYPPCVYFEVGIGFYAGSAPNSYGNAFLTQDFGAIGNAGPFVLGVVYNDLNHNNFYDIGEGLAGVTITLSSGGYYAVSSSSGGYAIPVDASGTVTVMASGPSFGPIGRTVTVSGANVKVDFTAGEQVSSTTTSAQTSSTTSTSAETSNTVSTSAQTSSSTTVATSISQTTSRPNNQPFIALDPIFAPAWATVNVSGSGFASGDSTCYITGSQGSISAWSCNISAGGGVTGSFVVANVAAGVYTITVTGLPAGDSVSVTFAVSSSSTETTTSTSTISTSAENTLASTSSTSGVTETSTTVVVSTSSVTTATPIVTVSTTDATSIMATDSIPLSVPTAMPPIAGFPWASIIVGIILGLAILGRRRK